MLEAGSELGYLVYPPLADNEAFRIEFEGDGVYRFTFYMGTLGQGWQPVFSMTMTLPVGGVGSTKENIEFHVRESPFTPEGARALARVFIVPEDCGTPTGGVAIRGATNFQTPAGWDTVYTSIFNNIERPVAPMLVVRVETDWYVHDTEFRYVLQPGEGVHGAHNLPIGQVFFVPREEITMRDATGEELDAAKQAKKAFFRDKAGVTLTTPYGLQYSPHYARRSKSNKATE